LFKIKQSPQIISLKLIQAYRWLSAFKAPVCRFQPTCSAYALQAINKYGFIIGWKLAIKRIAKCHPFNRGGLDPVP
jgi:uncharacterized protein